MKNLLFGIVVGIVLSLFVLIVVAIVYSMVDRTPDAVEICLVTWSLTIVTMTSGSIIIEACGD